MVMTAIVVWGIAGLAGAPSMTQIVGVAAATSAASPIASSAAETFEVVGLVTHPGPISVSELQTLQPVEKGSCWARPWRATDARA